MTNVTTTQDTPTLLDLREAVIVARRAHAGGAIHLDTLYATADRYIDGLRDYKKRTGKKLTIPGRSYLLRAL